MQPLRTTLQRVPQRLNRISKATKPIHTYSSYTKPTMSLFPRFASEFSPLFRLMDDYERHAFRHANQSIRTFSPKFDVKELKDSYELHGEFPGIEQKNINIEWTDANTLTISGRQETVREEGERPKNLIRQSGEDDDIAADENDNKGEVEHYHKPTVEDEGADTNTNNTTSETQIARKSEQQDIAKHNNNTPKFWVSERSVGEFHRSFNFPARVDQDAVKASLKDGVLSIVVPKAKVVKGRKINIE